MSKNPKTDVGVAIPSDMEPPAGGTLSDPQPDGPLMPGARRVKTPAAPKARGRKDGKTTSFSAPVPTIGDSA